MTKTLVNHGQCLTDETLTDYLEGGLEPAVKAATEAHLIICDHCRTKLAFFMRLLKDVQPEEEVAIREAQDQWARAHRDRQVPARRGKRRGWKMASGSVAAA